MTSFSLFDFSRPQDGAVITGQEIREILKAVATSSAGTTPPGGYAVLIGDIRFANISVAVRYKLAITINGTAATVNLSSFAVNSLVTPTQVVAAINAAFSAMGTVAYVYNLEAYDSTAFVAIVAPKPASGLGSITISEVNDGTDASANILGVQARGKGMPYTVTAVAPSYGSRWLQTSNGDDDSIRMYRGAPAAATGLLDLSDGSGTLNLSKQTSLRIKIGTPLAVFGPLDVDIRGAAPSATTPEEIVTKINTAFLAAPGWPSVTVGPAQLVTRNGSGKYIQVLSGPVNAPVTGPGSYVELSGLALGGTAGLNFLVDDAISLVFGLPRGIGGKLFSKVPHTFTGAEYTTNYIRGLGNRSGPGIGSWGPPLEASIDLPVAGAVDGEKRTDKLTGIDWIYRQSQSLLEGAGWSRAIPGYEYPVAYDKFNESYRLKSTTDTFVPQPLSRVSFDSSRPTTKYTVIDPGNTQAGKVGDAVTLVDGRDFLWKDGTYPDNRNFSDSAAIYDNFPTARYRLGRTREGLNWLLVDSNTPSITSTNPQRLRPIAGNIARTEALGASSLVGVRAYADGAGIVRQHEPITLSSTTTTTVTFTVPGVSNALPIKAGSFSIRMANAGAANPANDVTGSSELVTAGNFRAHDNGSGAIAGPGGITGTVNYNTGAVSIQFPTVSANIAAGYLRLVYAYSHTGLLVAAVDVRKDPAGETRAAGTVAEAGLIYGATANGSSGVDTGSGFMAVVRDDGTGGLFSLSGGTPTAIGAPFLIDPPLDTTWRTLRVLYQVEPGSPSSNAVHAVFWNGSNKPCDWITKDYSNPEAGLTALDTNGGVEVDRTTSKLALIRAVPVTGNPNETGFYTGVYAKGAAATGGYTEKIINIRNFQSHGGHKTNFTDTIPALPPVSAIRLRDTIGAVELLHNGAAPAGSAGEIITDCTAAAPLQIDLKGDLANTESKVDTPAGGRKLNISLRVGAALALKDLRFLPEQTYVPGLVGHLGLPVSNGPATQANFNGIFAVWDLSAFLVDDALWTPLDTQNSSYRSVSNTIGSPYLFGDVNDGSPASGGIVNSPRAIGVGNAGRPHRYWNLNEERIISGTPYKPSAWAAVPNQTTFRYKSFLSEQSVVFDTSLPIDGRDGIGWTYVVEKAEVLYETSQFLADYVRGGWTGINDNGISWNPQFPNAWPNGSSGAAYLKPTVTRVQRIGGSSGPFARFEIGISYFGPVRPIGISLVIKAYRKGIQF